MPGTASLFIPGPTNVPHRVRQAIDCPMEDQRSPDLPQFTLPLFQGTALPNLRTVGALSLVVGWFAGGFPDCSIREHENAITGRAAMPTRSVDT